MKRTLLTGLSATAVAIGLSAAVAPAWAANEIYQVPGASEVVLPKADTVGGIDISGKKDEAGSLVTIEDGHNLAGATGTTLTKKWNGTAWVNDSGASANTFTGQSVLSTRDRADGVVFKGASTVTGDMGSAAKGLESITANGAAGKTVAITGKVFTDQVSVGAGSVTISDTLSGSNITVDGATKSGASAVAFTGDGTLSVAGNATLGAVTNDVEKGNAGTLILQGLKNSAESIGSATASLKEVRVGGAARNAELTVSGESWIETLALKDSVNASPSTAILRGNANLVAVTVETDASNTLNLNGASNTIGTIGTGTHALGTLALGKDAALTVTGLDKDGKAVAGGGAKVDAVTLNGVTNSLTLGAGTVNSFGGAIGANITNNALKNLTLGAGSDTTVTGGVFSKKTTLMASDAKDVRGANLSGGANSNLGDLTLGLGYNAESLGGVGALSIGHVNVGANALTVNSLSVSASKAATSALVGAWNKRTTGDTAIGTGPNVLTFNSLMKDGTTPTLVTFDGVKQKVGGLDVGTAKNLSIADNMALWNFQLGQVGGADASLLAVQDAAGFRSHVASGANMNNFGGVVDGMISVVNDAKANSTLQNFISGLSTDEAATAVQQMADPSVNNSVVGGVKQASSAASNAITANIGGGTGTSVASNSLVSGVNAGDLTKRNNAWLQVIGSWSDQSRRKGVDGYTADTYGFALGADTLVSDTTRLGLALHYANTNVDGKGVFSRNNSEVNTYGVTLYGQQNLTDALFLDGRLGYAYNDVSSDRYVNGLDGKASGSYGANQFDVAAKIGYNAKVASNTTLTPHFGLGYTYLGENSYTEGGNAARLRVGSRDTNALLIGAGVRGAVEFETTDKTKIIPELRLGASYDALASDMNTTARFVGGGSSFTTRNVKPDPWTFNVGAGVNVATTGNFTVSANYDAALSGNFAGHTGSLRGKMKF